MRQDRDNLIKTVLRDYLGKLQMDTTAREALIANCFTDIIGVLNRVRNEKLGQKVQAVAMTPDSSMSVDRLSNRNKDDNVESKHKINPPEMI